MLLSLAEHGKLMDSAFAALVRDDKFEEPNDAFQRVHDFEETERIFRKRECKPPPIDEAQSPETAAAEAETTGQTPSPESADTGLAPPAPKDAGAPSALTLESLPSTKTAAAEAETTGQMPSPESADTGLAPPAPKGALTSSTSQATHPDAASVNTNRTKYLHSSKSKIANSNSWISNRAIPQLGKAVNKPTSVLPDVISNEVQRRELSDILHRRCPSILKSQDEYDDVLVTLCWRWAGTN
jgi:hypothetical protein